MVTITTLLPPFPKRAEGRDDFSDEADAFGDAMVQYQQEQNQQAADLNTLAAQAAASAASAVNAPGSNGTSGTALTIALGDQNLLIQAGKNFVKGQWVQIASSANVLNYMIGTIKSYDTVVGTLVVSVQRISGNGNFSDWVVSLGGAVLPDGTPRNLAAGSTVKDQTGAPLDRPIGYRGLPKKSINAGSYTLTPADVGFCLELKAGANIILPRNSTLPAASQFSASDSTIVLRDVAGATHSISPAASAHFYDGSTGNDGARTLKVRGQVTVDLSGELVDSWYGSGAMS